MQRYDTLKDTWIYAEIKQQIQEEEHAIYIQEYRQVLEAIVRARFPRLTHLTRDVMSQITNPAVLRDLIVMVSTAKMEKEVRHGLNEQKKSGSEEGSG
jgi:uncharacterized Zn finger protein